ncbi:permease-like cell division protein FtsX [Ferrimonas marina]|uniref:Cell division protein FtsX n=1 Tax=Ferrimonas marina TaxID=299255 RepID=A0A1M5XNZ5_9GAMM|nr:permease-like cell division protein FtsX [Ferrimonas marina]SHI01547.1 cell division transport system permease protein [Ferrimonas marina]
MNLKRRKLPLGQRMVSFLAQHLRQLLASLGELWRTPMTSLMTLLVLGFSLSLPALLLVLANNAAKVEQQWHSAAEINLFLQMDLAESRQQALVTRLRGMPELIEVQWQSADAALEEFRQNAQFGDALAYLDDNPLPAVIRVLPSARHSGAEAARSLRDRLAGEPEVALARLDLDWLQRLEALTATGRQAGAALGLLLLVAVVLITANTIRLSIMQRSDEIRVMKLVGATEGFIRRPFLYGGLWLGLLSALLALVLVNAMLVWLDGAMAQLLSLYRSQFRLDGLSAQQGSGLMLGACLLGWLGAYLSVRRHLRAIEPQ